MERQEPEAISHPPAAADVGPMPEPEEPASPVNILVLDNPLAGAEHSADDAEQEVDKDLAMAAAGLRALALADAEGEPGAAMDLHSLGAAARPGEGNLMHQEEEQQSVDSRAMMAAACAPSDGEAGGSGQGGRIPAIKLVTSAATGANKATVGNSAGGGSGSSSCSPGSGLRVGKKRLTFSGPPAVGRAKPAPRANYSHSQVRVRQILQVGPTMESGHVL